MFWVLLFWVLLLRITRLFFVGILVAGLFIAFLGTLRTLLGRARGILWFLTVALPLLRLRVVLLKLLSQISSAIGDLLLVLGQFGWITRTFSSTAHAALNAFQSLEFLDVVFDFLCFVFQAIRTVFAQQ